jgi:hypothetical protein
MITEYPLEHRRYDGSEYEPFWAAAAALDLPLSLHTATRRQGRIRRAGPGTLRDASSRATKAFYPALSLCDLIFSGVFERHPRLRVAIASSSSWRGRPTCSRRWTTRTASATARRSTGSSTVCLWSLGAHFAIWAQVCTRYSGLLRSFRRQHREGAHHPAGGSNHGELQGDIIGQSRV